MPLAYLLNLRKQKIILYGIHGVAHKWIMSYLENRSQFVYYELRRRSTQTMFWCATRICFRSEVVYSVHK